MGVGNVQLETAAAESEVKGHDDRQQQPHNGHGFSADLAVGLLSTTLVTTLTYPLHRIKVIIQTQDANPDVVSGVIRRYTPLNSVPRIWREQGLASLWRGTTPYILRHVPGTSLSFAFRDFFQRRTPSFDAKKQFWQMTAVNIATGGLAGGAALALVYPLEFATVRMAADLGGKGRRQFGSGIFQAWAQAVRADGPLAIYRGFGVAAISVVAYRGLYFGLYDSMKALSGSPRTPTPSHPHHSTGTARLAAPDRPQHSAAQHSTDRAADAAPPTPPQHSTGSAPQHSMDRAADAAAASTPQHSTGTAPQHSMDRAAVAAAPSTSQRSTLTASQHSSDRAADAAAPAPQHSAAQHSTGGAADSASQPSRWERLAAQYALAQACVYASVAITYPLDIIRKRMIVDAGAGEGRQFSGAVDCVRKIAAREGLRGFYRFFGYDLVFRLGGGVLLVLYDELKRVAGR